MKRNAHHFLIAFATGIALLLISSCQSDKKDAPNETVQELPQDAPADVTTTTLKSVDFEHELVSNGKIKAQTVAELKFQTAEVIAKIYVKNGSHVQNGQKIAELDTYSLQNRLNQAKDALERSRLEFQDVLIGQGYKLDNPDVVPEDVMQLAKVKSGYNGAQTQFEMAKYDLEKASLVAPISGVVANLFAKPHTLSSPSEVFCNIIDTRSLEVEFTVLENELGFIKMDDNVKIAPFSIPDLTVNGRVTEINP